MARTSLSRRLLAGAAALTLLAAVAEGGSRLVWSAEDTALNPQLPWLVDHPTLLWIPQPGLQAETADGITTNSLGLRDNEVAPRPPTTRILSMGESTTWGHGVSGAETYSQRLEARLLADGADAEVINAGVSAWSIWQSYVFLVEHGTQLGPDAVLLYHQQSDSEPRLGRSDRARYEARRPWRSLLGLLDESRLYSGLRQRLTAPVPGSARVPPADRLVALEGIAAICQSMGTELIVLQPVYRDHAAPDDILQQFAASSSKRLIDLPAHRQRDGVSDAVFFLDPLHPSAAGHDRIAGWIHSEIVGASWIY